MSYPIKYMEENLIFNKNGNVYAYYEWMPYNYSFISTDKALGIFENIKELVEQSKTDKFDLLQIATEESIHDTIERCKKEVRGNLKDIAYDHLDKIEDHLKNRHGDYELDYRYFIGFKLSANDFELSKGSVWEDLKNGIKDGFKATNQQLFGDYTVITTAEIERYLKLEKLLKHRISRRFKMRRVTPSDYGYIIRHINGGSGIGYDSYNFLPELTVNETETRVKTYDIMHLADSLIEEKQRFIKIMTEDKEYYVAYLVVSDLTGDIVFPNGSEVFYYQQGSFNFPVDVSLKVENLNNKDALGTLRNKKMELKDLDESAYMSGNESSNNLLQARGDTNELEAILEKSKEDMYKISYVIRVSAESEEDLVKNITEVKDFYKRYNMILQRPLGDQLGLHEEFYPSAVRYLNDYIHYVTSDFIASLGFGSARMLGEREGIYIGYNEETGRSVYIKPWLAAQGVAGAITNALAMILSGSLGGGKSLFENLMDYYIVLFGGMVFLLDPKAERGGWEEGLSHLGDNLNLIDVTSDKKNKGLLDGFYIMDDENEAEQLVLDILMYLTGINIRDSKRFPVLSEHVKKVAHRKENRGMMFVIEELRKTNTDLSNEIATHIESFTKLSIGHLLFGDGEVKNPLKIEKPFNVVMIEDLVMPEAETPLDEYSSIELLSVAIMLSVSTFSLQFIKKDRSIYKKETLEEAWAMLKHSVGKTLSKKLERTGRSKNASIAFVTQNCSDLSSEKMQNNIGMKFAFKSNDRKETEETLKFFGLEVTEENIERIMNLDNGYCLFQDIYGHCGIIYIDYVFQDLFEVWDTRPPMEKEE